MACVGRIGNVYAVNGLVIRKQQTLFKLRPDIAFAVANNK